MNSVFDDLLFLKIVFVCNNITQFIAIRLPVSSREFEIVPANVAAEVAVIVIVSVVGSVANSTVVMERKTVFLFEMN